MSHVYLDHNATTPLDERVLAAMLPFLREHYGNASSRHEFGTQARRAVEVAREQVAALVGAVPAQVVFTSGGTEANNAFIKGAAGMLQPAQMVISALEHPCVAKPAAELVRAGWKLRKFATDGDGRVNAADAAAALAGPAGVVSVMLANNETGVIQDVAALGEQARAAGAWMHTDAVQALGKIAIDFTALNVHAMTLSAHKIYGPKGVGALVLDKRIELRPLLSGGGHEQGMRSGTENVAGIVGFGAACEIAASRQHELAPRLAALRERFERGLDALDTTVFGATILMARRWWWSSTRPALRSPAVQPVRVRAPSRAQRCWRWAWRLIVRVAPYVLAWGPRLRPKRLIPFCRRWRRPQGA